MTPIRAILYPTDFSPQAACAFPLACALARDYGARLVVLHVKPPLPPGFAELGAVPPEPAMEGESLREQMGRVRPKDPAVRMERHLGQGEPATEILALARGLGCDLIVMGTHGRTGVSRLLMGSVAEQVMRKAFCPVVTVRAPAAAASPAPMEKALQA
jgi:nucleotide-binding universal stress UspA family protein